MGVNDSIAEELTRHAVNLQRLSNATINKIVALLNRSDARIVERLLSDDVSDLSRARQEALLREIRRIIESVHEDATKQLRIELDALAEYEGEYQAEMIVRETPVKLDFVRPAPAQIVAAVNSRPFQGKLLKEWYTELEEGTFRRMRDTIRAGFVEGRTNDQIVRELRGTRANGYKDGVLEITRRHAETTVRTAVMHTAATARNYVYEANRDIIKAEKFLATLDSKVTLQCAGLDGKSFDVGKGPIPPLHVNCRSTRVPVLKSWRELGIDIDDLDAGTRASMNGQLPADTTYNDFLKKQSVEFQDSVLGESRARLFRQGVSVDRFTNRAGDTLTLDELRKREASAFARAGL